MDGRNAIEVKGVSKSFYVETAKPFTKKGILSKKGTEKIEKKVLENISFNVKKGEVIGVLGRNGSGKSTLLTILAGILEPDSGTIEHSGKVASILELGMGFHPDMSGRENIYLKSELYGFSKKEVEGRIDEIIDYSGIRSYIDNPVRTYSSGMRGRLAFAVITHVDSDILLIDEALSVGDSTFSAKARDHFKKLARAGRTIVLVTHNISYMESTCTRVIWIDEGRIRKDGPAKKVCAEYVNTMSESPEIIMDLAKEGVADSQYKLAQMFLHGGVFGKDESLYREWLECAARQGHTKAQVEYGELLVHEGSASDAMCYFQSAANKGDSDAKLRLSSMGCDDDPIVTEMLNLFEQASKDGDGQQKYRYADLLLKTALTKEDRKKAFDVFCESAELGNPNAMHQVGIMYRDGIGISKDNAKMEEYLSKASDAGSVKSMVMLSDIYTQGKILHSDDERAFREALKAAELGNVNMMYRVACCYRDGTGCDVDNENANGWFTKYRNSMLFQNKMWAIDLIKTGKFKDRDISKMYDSAMITPNIPLMYQNILYKVHKGRDVNEDVATLRLYAESGNLDAIKKLGDLYYEGVGIEKDCKEALAWYVKASDMGDPWSKIKAGEMYRDGSGTDVDMHRACDLFMESGKMGNVTGLWNVIRLHSLGDINDRKTYSEAVSILESVANTGNVDAMKRMGSIYFDGFGAKRNYSEAFEWYRKAAKLGDSSSKQKVAEMYRDGKGVKKNLKLAAEWFVS